MQPFGGIKTQQKTDIFRLGIGYVVMGLDKVLSGAWT
jgi:hypothetical protein